jgi:hypothetical protein
MKSQPQRVHMLQYPGHPESGTGVPSVRQGTPCGTLLSTSFSIPVIVPKTAVRAMQGKSPGNRSSVMGISKVRSKVRSKVEE